MGVALAWLLQHSPNILLIPGTSSAAHLRENVTGAGLSPGGGSAVGGINCQDQGDECILLCQVVID